MLSRYFWWCLYYSIRLSPRIIRLCTKTKYSKIYEAFDAGPGHDKFIDGPALTKEEKESWKKFVNEIEGCRIQKTNAIRLTKILKSILLGLRIFLTKNVSRPIYWQNKNSNAKIFKM